MPLTPTEVKERLGYGATTDIATRFGLTKGHVSQVLSGLRADRRIARHVAKRLKIRLDELPAEYQADARSRSAATAA